MTHEWSESTDGAGSVACQQIDARQIILDVGIILGLRADLLELLAGRIALTQSKQADGELVARVKNRRIESQRRPKFLSRFRELVVLYQFVALANVGSRGDG